MHRLDVYALIVSALPFVLACGDACPTGMVSSTTGCVAELAPTWDAIYADVIVEHCAIEFCHGDPEDMNEADLDLRGIDEAFARLDEVTMSEDCGHTALRLVEPGDPESSLLYLKLFRESGEDEALCGFRMPYSADPLPHQWRRAIRDWIEAGAPR